MVQLFKIPEWFIWASFGGVLAAAVWKGSWQATVILSTQIGQMLYQRLWICFSDICLGGFKDERAWQYILQDVLLTAVALGCALTSRRYWVQWAASLGLVAISQDLLIAYAPLHITVWAQKWMAYIMTYCTLLLVVWDICTNIRIGRETPAISTPRLARA